jgi:hypothetical protein
VPRGFAEYRGDLQLTHVMVPALLGQLERSCHRALDSRIAARPLRGGTGAIRRGDEYVDVAIGVREGRIILFAVERHAMRDEPDRERNPQEIVHDVGMVGGHHEHAVARRVELGQVLGPDRVVDQERQERRIPSGRAADTAERENEIGAGGGTGAARRGDVATLHGMTRLGEAGHDAVEERVERAVLRRAVHAQDPHRRGC